MSAKTDPDGGPVWAWLAEYDTADALVAAAGRTRAEGYRRIDAYTPFPVEGLDRALDIRERALAPVAIVGGVLGGGLGLFLQWYGNAVDYPINVGGRPLADWTAFFLPAYEMTILFAAVGTILAMLGLNGLPRLRHPVMNSDRFERASVDRFLLAIEAADAQADAERTPAFLRDTGALSVEAVAP